MSVKGLHKMIYPFAPDQSGAASVLYELGGLIIIVDAGGCAGNVCGFDEPRWLGTKSAVFSAGLRDMDAILGRDDLMIEKIAKASKRLDANFIAIIGTPVPATIATDYRALKRMAEKRTGLPVITMDTNGIAWYDEGIKKAYLELFRKFAPESGSLRRSPLNGDDPVKAGENYDSCAVGVLGITPLDFGGTDAAGRAEEILRAKGAGQVMCYGAKCAGSAMTDGRCSDPLNSFRNPADVDRNIVAAPGGLAAARRLKEKFGIPYECFDPLAEDVWREACKRFRDENSGAEPAEALAGKKILIIHQQIRANTLRGIIRQELQCRANHAVINVASWFMMDRESKEEGDFRIREESDFFDMIENGGYDVIMADGIFRKAAKGFEGIFIDLPHFAVSGTL